MNDIDKYKTKQLLDDLLATRENQIYQLSVEISTRKSVIEHLEADLKMYEKDAEVIEQVLRGIDD